MSDATDRVERRLKTCFELALPRADPATIAGATLDGAAGWDSVATLILVAAVEEEFSVAIGFDAVPRLTSFAAFQEYLAAELAGGPGAAR